MQQLFEQSFLASDIKLKEVTNSVSVGTKCSEAADFAKKGTYYVKGKYQSTDIMKIQKKWDNSYQWRVKRSLQRLETCLKFATHDNTKIGIKNWKKWSLKVKGTNKLKLY